MTLDLLHRIDQLLQIIQSMRQLFDLKQAHASFLVHWAKYWSKVVIFEPYRYRRFRSLCLGPQLYWWFANQEMWMSFRCRSLSFGVSMAKCNQLYWSVIRVSSVWDSFDLLHAIGELCKIGSFWSTFQVSGNLQEVYDHRIDEVSSERLCSHANCQFWHNLGVSGICSLMFCHSLNPLPPS